MLLPRVLQAGGTGLLDGVAVEMLMTDTATAELGLVGDVVMLSFRFCHGRSRKNVRVANCPGAPAGTGSATGGLHAIASRYRAPYADMVRKAHPTIMAECER